MHNNGLYFRLLTLLAIFITLAGCNAQNFACAYNNLSSAKIFVVKGQTEKGACLAAMRQCELNSVYSWRCEKHILKADKSLTIS